MEKNYYDILEINRNASQEIVEKAYKTLAKKYHPDLQEDSLKYEYEEKLKLINEAYEVLSNPDKRTSYNEELDFEQEKNFQQSYTNNIKTNYTKPEPDPVTSPRPSEYIPPHTNQNKEEEQKIKELEQQLLYEQTIQEAKEKAYYDAYIQDLKNRGYKIRYKKSFKDYIKGIICIFVVIFILFLIYQIPSIKNYVHEIYETNSIVHNLIDIILNIFKKV